MAAPEWETFYKETNEPHNIDEAKLLVQKFVDRHEEKGSRIVLITVMTSATFAILYQSLSLCYGHSTFGFDLGREWKPCST